MSFGERGEKTRELVLDGSKGVVMALRATNGTVFSLPLEQRRWLLGSGTDCDFVINDPFVSSTHCVVERRDSGALVVRDRRSRNGTRIDGNSVEAAELQVGARLLVGKTTLVAMAAGEAPPVNALASLRGQDPVFRAAVDQALRLAKTDCSIMITGETGTGKDVLARVIHEASPRAAGPFVAINCGGIPHDLIGSELFGHEKGAFTGAHVERDGYFAQADTGTLFLDEIGELPMALQPHLLRALETRRVRRVGGSTERAVDVRIIAATHRNQAIGSDDARLRTDLYHRIATVVLTMPPLRERKGDLEALVKGVLEDLVGSYGRREVSPDGWLALTQHDWPGNVRELRHAVMRAVALGADVLGPDDFFPKHISWPAALRDAPLNPPIQPYERTLRREMEQALLTAGTIRAAAVRLGMPKSTFAERAERWGIPRPPQRRTRSKK